MCKRILCSLLISLGFATAGIAQQQETPARDLELNLEQFPDGPDVQQNTLQSDELKLNLEQFDKPEATDEPDADQNLELNLEQFEAGNDATRETTPESTVNRIDQADAPQKSYRGALLIGGIVFLVFLYVLSKRRSRKR